MAKYPDAGKRVCRMFSFLASSHHSCRHRFCPKNLGVAQELKTRLDRPGSVTDMTLLQDELHRWTKDMDVWLMLMLVAFLMLFIKKYE